MHDPTRRPAAPRAGNAKRMSILCIGSINVDHVYEVPHLAGPGETVLARTITRGLGGKGANMSLAAAKAGARVVHVGCVGADAAWIRQHLADAGVDIAHVRMVDRPTGHAIIQVDPDGENAITVFSGANHALSEAQVFDAIASAGPGDWLLLQNETNLVADAALAAKRGGLSVAYAAAPFDPEVTAEILASTDLLAVNATEARQLAEHVGVPAPAWQVPAVLITDGAAGAAYRTPETCVHVPAFPVHAIDTTGAGDTFSGVLLAGLDMGHAPPRALTRAAAAAALQITRQGAAAAIPTGAEVDAFLATHGTNRP